MIYLSEFYFPSQNSEANYLAESPRAKMTCYDSFYPFGLFAGRGLKALDLADVTILYGGNGSGKTTALNVMADALRLQRGAQYNRSDFFPDYVSLCQFHTLHAIPAGSLILTSDRHRTGRHHRRKRWGTNPNRGYSRNRYAHHGHTALSSYRPPRSRSRSCSVAV